MDKLTQKKYNEIFKEDVRRYVDHQKNAVYFVTPPFNGHFIDKEAEDKEFNFYFNRNSPLHKIQPKNRSKSLQQTFEELDKCSNNIFVSILETRLFKFIGKILSKIEKLI